MTVQTCEHETDNTYHSRCEAPHRFVVSRADGDTSYSGGTMEGRYYVCAAHLQDALFGMADGDQVALTVGLRYDDEQEARHVA